MADFGQLPSVGKERFVRDTRSFFATSKYLLQLVRHKRLVRLAFEEGYTHLTLREGVDFPIREGDFVGDAREPRQRHRSLAAGLFESLADEATLWALHRPNRGTLRDWVHWYWGRGG